MTVELVRNTDNIYDLLALCCKYLLDRTEAEHYDFWKFDDDEFDSVYDMIESYTSEIIDKGHKTAYLKLKREVCTLLSTGVSLEKCHAIVKYIDELVDVEINNNAVKMPGFRKYNTLNHAYSSDVRIIPKIKDTFLKNEEGEFILKDPSEEKYSFFREEGECYASCIDEVTHNYMIWDKSNVEKFPFTIIRIDEDSSLAKHFYHRNKVTIGIVPFTCKGIRDILNIKFEGDTFHVENMYKEANEELKFRYKNIYMWSQNKDIDFLIYPEMLMSEDIIDSITDEELMNNGPKFIINGSVWTNYSNRAIATDLFGSRVFTYYKKCGFKYRENEKKYKEALDYTINKEYIILEIGGFGRIGVCICKDLADENVLMFHKLINTNILFVPAFSDSFQLRNDAKAMASKYNCMTVFANSCAAYCKHWSEDKGYDIGFIMIPAKLETSSDSYMKNYTAQKCYESCDSGCCCKVFTIAFDEIKEYNGMLSIDIQGEDD